MERKMTIPLLFLLLVTLQVLCIPTCPSLPDKNLPCYSDYNHTITCVWNNTYEPDTVCTIHAKKTFPPMNLYSSSCELQPADSSRPTLQKCTLDFKKDYLFQSFHELSISLSCEHEKQTILEVTFRPHCHIKLHPPEKPNINFTTVSWSAQVKKSERIPKYMSQLQWKKWDLSWSDPSVTTESPITYKDLNCKKELDQDLLIQGERYEARVRVKPDLDDAEPAWSDWSTAASWVSPVGTKPTLQPPLPDLAGGVLGMIAAGTIFALFLVVILFKNNKATWVIKKIRGQPLPDPGKSFLQDVRFQNWLSPHFTSKSFYPSKSEDISSVEVTSTVDAVTLCSKEAALLEKMKSESSCKSGSSSFSNPSYSELCPPPPHVCLPIMGNLEPCATDKSNGTVGSQGEGKTAEQDKEEERRKELEILQLLSKGNSNSEPVEVISDYEKVEKIQVEHFRLQSLDSGMCSGEEVSQESLEADSISATDSHDEGAEGKEGERKGGNGKIDFQKLFGGSGSVFAKGSILVCSDYERVQKLQPGSPELHSLDSGVISGGEEQVSHEESLEDNDKSTESTAFLFPPPSSCASPCSMPSFPQLPLEFSGTGLSPALPPPNTNHILGRIALMSISRSVEPSGDGYMPVRQEQC